ncbi:MAG TPA: hypothetical protein VHE30_08740 [Polyangiaceae bacterium]|nr:hypothetical protein [Polyangiaceae bacterium]
MALKSSVSGFGIVVAAALASACSGASDGSKGQGGALGGFGGALDPYGNGGGGGDVASSGGTGTGGGGFVAGTGGDSVGSGGTSSGGALGAGGTPLGAGGDSVASGGEGTGTGGGGGGADPTADSASTKGPCTVQTYTQGVAGGQDYVNPTVYYPTDCPGPFPGVVVIPGFTEDQSWIRDWGTFLASHGFATMTVDTAAGGIANTGVQPPSRALGLWEGVQTLKGENTRSGSPLAGKVATDRMAVMGHSMGGGGTLLAANAHPELKAAIGLCPWNPGVTYPQDVVPSLMFDGTGDFLVPPTQSLPEYQSIPTTTPKAYVEFTGGSHWVSNTPLGTAATDKIVARIGLSWLEVHMNGDTRYQQFIAKDPATMSNFDMKP